MDVETNVNSEMSDLVHHAEEWAAGFNRVPELSLRELKKHRIGRQIVTRAAFLLWEKLGIRSSNDYSKNIGGQANEENENATSPVSPMPIEEFQSILKNGWPIDEPLTHSPFCVKRRTSMLTDLIPLSPIASEASQTSPKKFAVPKLPARRSDPAPHVRKLFTTTPQSKTMYKRTYSMTGGTPATNQLMRKEIITPMKIASTPKPLRQSPVPTEGETPMENRASRLRRLKLEEKRRSVGGERDNSMNSSFGKK